MLMARPVFSVTLDADPAVRAWLDGLDQDERRELRDDVTPMFKEVAVEAKHFVRMKGDDEEAHPPHRLSEEVLDGCRFPDMSADVQAAFMRAARAHLPDWQFRAFVLWFSGANRGQVARVLGVSRATVRRALDGGGRDGPGAIASFTAAIQQDPDFKKVVMNVATKSISKRETEATERILLWFKGLDGKPNMVFPLAMLLVLDELADARREVKVADVIPHFPRSTISDCMKLLRAEGYASSDGHSIKVHRTPCTRMKENP